MRGYCRNYPMELPGFPGIPPTRLRSATGLAVTYSVLAGRRHEVAEISRLLDRAARGTGGLLVLYGPAGSGKTALAEAAVAGARGRDLGVHWASPPQAQPGRLAWAQLLRDTG